MVASAGVAHAAASTTAAASAILFSPDDAAFDSARPRRHGPQPVSQRATGKRRMLPEPEATSYKATQPPTTTEPETTPHTAPEAPPLGVASSQVVLPLLGAVAPQDLRLPSEASASNSVSRSELLAMFGAFKEELATLVRQQAVSPPVLSAVLHRLASWTHPRIHCPSTECGAIRFLSSLPMLTSWSALHSSSALFRQQLRTAPIWTPSLDLHTCTQAGIAPSPTPASPVLKLACSALPEQHRTATAIGVATRIFFALTFLTYSAKLSLLSVLFPHTQARSQAWTPSARSQWSILGDLSGRSTRPPERTAADPLLRPAFFLYHIGLTSTGIRAR